MTYEDRKRIEQLYVAGATHTEIANELGVHLSTVYNELNRGSTGVMDENGRLGYSAEHAQQTLLESLKRRGKKQRRDKQNE